MVSVTSASLYITSASLKHLHYQSRSSMYIRGLIPQNFAEYAEAIQVDILNIVHTITSQLRDVQLLLTRCKL